MHTTSAHSIQLRICKAFALWNLLTNLKVNQDTIQKFFINLLNHHTVNVMLSCMLFPWKRCCKKMWGQCWTHREPGLQNCESSRGRGEQSQPAEWRGCPSWPAQTQHVPLGSLHLKSSLHPSAQPRRTPESSNLQYKRAARDGNH